MNDIFEPINQQEEVESGTPNRVEDGSGTKPLNSGGTNVEGESEPIL